MLSSSQESSKPAVDARGDLQCLKERFGTAADHYEGLRESAENSVARWVWATRPRYHLDPLYFLSNEESVGRLGLLPDDPRGWVAYGFSRENRIVVERQFLTDLAGRYYSTFYVETEDRTLSYHFDHAPAHECINCAQLIFAGVSPAYYQQWAIMGWASYTYITADGRIHSFNEVFQQDDDPQQRISGELRYGEGGRIEVWTKWPGARKPELTFRGTAPAENPFLRTSRGKGEVRHSTTERRD